VIPNLLIDVNFHPGLISSQWTFINKGPVLEVLTHLMPIFGLRDLQSITSPCSIWLTLKMNR